MTAEANVLHARGMHCHACDADHALGPGERIGFRDSCDRCGTDLHTCLHCVHYDAATYNECRESGAERVLEKDRANRCDWFSPGGDRGGDGSSKSSALADLENLFKK